MWQDPDPSGGDALDETSQVSSVKTVTNSQWRTKKTTKAAITSRTTTTTSSTTVASASASAAAAAAAAGRVANPAANPAVKAIVANPSCRNPSGANSNIIASSSRSRINSKRGNKSSDTIGDGDLKEDVAAEEDDENTDEDVDLENVTLDDHGIWRGDGGTHMKAVLVSEEESGQELTKGIASFSAGDAIANASAGAGAGTGTGTGTGPGTGTGSGTGERDGDDANAGAGKRVIFVSFGLPIRVTYTPQPNTLAMMRAGSKQRGSMSFSGEEEGKIVGERIAGGSAKQTDGTDSDSQAKDKDQDHNLARVGRKGIGEDNVHQSNDGDDDNDDDDDDDDKDQEDDEDVDIFDMQIRQNLSMLREGSLREKYQQGSARVLCADDVTIRESFHFLNSARAGLGDMQTLWVGCPQITNAEVGAPGGAGAAASAHSTLHPGATVDLSVDKVAQEVIRSKLKKKGTCVPVFLEKDNQAEFGKFIWMLFHYVPMSLEHVRLAQQEFEDYQSANQMFLDAILEVYKPGDIVWIHDYHLMLLPAMLRERLPDAIIGFFLHSPFPSSEIYRMVPFRSQLLHGVMGANLLGFQTHDYLRHFASSCTRVVGAQSRGPTIELGSWVAHTVMLPSGIEPSRFSQALKSKQVQRKYAALRAKFRQRNRKLIVGVDPIDHIKGLPLKLFALEYFFIEHPEFIGRVTLVQIGVPNLKSTQLQATELRSLIHEQVGRINGRFGTEDWMPIHYLDQDIPMQELVALLTCADIGIISSLRDGNGHLAYEFVACQQRNVTSPNGPGVVIISEFDGAAQSLGAGSISVNPWSIADVADAICNALHLSLEERRALQSYAFAHIKKHSGPRWARSFIRELMHAAVQQEANRKIAGLELQFAQPLDTDAVIAAFARSRRRLIISGFNGSIRRQRTYNREGRLSKVSQDVLDSIHTLAQNHSTVFATVTSRGRNAVDDVLGGTDAWIAAEDGAFLRVGNRNEHEWQSRVNHMDLSWIEGVLRVCKYFTERTPGTFFRSQETRITWHYSSAKDSVLASHHAQEMITHLTGGPLTNMSTEVTDVDGIVTIRPIGVNKCNAIRMLIDEVAYLGTASNSSPDISLRSDSRTPVGHARRLSGSSPLFSHSVFTPSPASGHRRLDGGISEPIDFLLVMGDFIAGDQAVFFMVNEMADRGSVDAAIPLHSSRSLPNTSPGAAFRPLLPVPSTVNVRAVRTQVSPLSLGRMQASDDVESPDMPPAAAAVDSLDGAALQSAGEIKHTNKSLMVNVPGQNRSSIWSVSIGKDKSCAQHSLSNVDMGTDLLARLAEIAQAETKNAESELDNDIFSPRGVPPRHTGNASMLQMALMKRHEKRIQDLQSTQQAQDQAPSNT